jgi:hypothetical protein
MEKRKRKSSSLEISCSKRARNYDENIDSEHLVLLKLIEIRKLQQKLNKSEIKYKYLEDLNNDLKNEKKDYINYNKLLGGKLEKLEKRILRIEKFNQDLREKNLFLEEQLQNKKEIEICDEFNNHLSIVEPYSYIN